MAISASAALVGVAVFVVVLQATAPDDRDADPTDPRLTAPQPSLQRLAFARQGAFDTEDDAASLRPTLPPEAAQPGSWSTEVHPEAAPSSSSSWRSVLLPSFRLRREPQTPRATLRHYTLKERLTEIAPTANARLSAKFEAAKIAWPPTEIALVAIKDARSLELHARSASGAWKLVHAYRIQAASGGIGPKLRQGDKQVPEGIYSIAFLNPNSAYHLSLRVNYPNSFDRQMAAKDGRKDLGGDIMIHGKNLSAGCLAMGDEAVEELFALAAQVGIASVRVIISPTDFREHATPTKLVAEPQWLPKLYAEIATAMADFKAPPRQSTGLLSFFSH